MITVSRMIKLYEGYTAGVTDLLKKADKTAQSFFSAGTGDDGLLSSLRKTEAMAKRANTSFDKLTGKIVNMKNVIKTMNLADSYMNINTKLGLVTDGMEEQKVLQQDIFAAAHRSGGNYGEMAAASARLMEGDVFGNGKKAVDFTELLTKSVKLSGGGQAQQSAVLNQMTEAITSGRLESSDFSFILRDVPVVAATIADYMGVSTRELEAFASQGLLTSDIVKNAMLSAADEINGKFNQLPMTFGDACSRIKNVGMNAFGKVFEELNQGLNSETGLQVFNTIVSGFYTAADFIGILVDGALWFGKLIMDNWGMILPVVTALIGAFMAYNIVLKINNGLLAIQNASKTLHSIVTIMEEKATFRVTRNQYGLNAALLACPLTWVAAGLMVIVSGLYFGVAMFNKFTNSSLSATGLIMGAIFGLAAFLYNTLFYPFMSVFTILANFMGNVFNVPVASVIILIGDMVTTCIDYMINLLKSIEAIINKIPSVTIDITSGLDDFSAGLKAEVSAYKDEHGWRESAEILKTMDIVAMTEKGYSLGSDAADSVASLFDRDIFGSEPFEFDPSPYVAGGDDPMTVKGAGQGGAVKVENEDDIEWMRRLAERDYVARISQNTLAPNIRVEFTGPITKEADVDGVAAHMAEQLKEVIASSPEGVYV